jgi:SAM-dependent methyltransferase
MPPTGLLRSAQAYWDASAETYEQDFAGTLIGQTRRQAVWCKLDRVFRAGQRILELNCGTGIDAVHLAERGVRVLACDLSPRMIELGRERVKAANLQDCVDLRVLSTENIGALFAEGPFDGVFSNFSGLNCVEDLSEVARNLAPLLKSGAPAVLCMMGRLVPWEIAWFLAHGDPRKALRRLRRAGAHGLETGQVKVQCPSVKEVADQLAPEFSLKTRQGIGILVPPSYMEHWARRFPRVTQALARGDRVLGRMPVLRGMGDCVLMNFERRREGKTSNASQAAAS